MVGSDELEKQLYWLWSFSPIQGSDSVDTYYGKFCNWREKLARLNYQATEESYVEDFVKWLQWDIYVRVYDYHSELCTMSDALTMAMFEEKMLLCEEVWGNVTMHVEENKVFDKMPEPVSMEKNEEMRMMCEAAQVQVIVEVDEHKVFDETLEPFPIDDIKVNGSSDEEYKQIQQPVKLGDLSHAIPKRGVQLVATSHGVVSENLPVAHLIEKFAIGESLESQVIVSIGAGFGLDLMDEMPKMVSTEEKEANNTKDKPIAMFAAPKRKHTLFSSFFFWKKSQNSTTIGSSKLSTVGEKYFEDGYVMLVDRLVVLNGRDHVMTILIPRNTTIPTNYLEGVEAMLPFRKQVMIMLSQVKTTGYLCHSWASLCQCLYQVISRSENYVWDPGLGHILGDKDVFKEEGDVRNVEKCIYHEKKDGGVFCVLM